MINLHENQITALNAEYTRLYEDNCVGCETEFEECLKCDVQKRQFEIEDEMEEL